MVSTIFNKPPLATLFAVENPFVKNPIISVNRLPVLPEMASLTLLKIPLISHRFPLVALKRRSKKLLDVPSILRVPTDTSRPMIFNFALF
jgi:hypothetical protein